MHPVLIYSIVFIAITISLLFAFERFQLGSIYLLLLLSSIVTFFIGKFLVKLIPMDDPMHAEIQKEQKRIQANQYQYEIQFLFNIVQPDPKLQPSPKRVAGSLEDCFDLDKEIIHKRLNQYFGDNFSFSTQQPIAELIEEMRSKYKDWSASRNS